MATQEQGLFGISPEQLMQGRADTDYARNLAAVQLTPMQQGNLMMRQGASEIGRAGASMLGIEDPQLQAAKEAQALAGQFDVSTSAGLKDLTLALQKRAQETGNQALASLIPQAAAAYQKAQLNEATVTAKTREQLPNIAKQQAYRDQLIAAYGPNDPRVKEVTAEIEGSAQGKGTKVNVDLGGLANIFAKKEAEEGAKAITERIGKAQQALSSNSKVSRDIAEIESILPNTFTGQFANFNKTASKTLSAMGVPISEKASNTETLNALTNNLVIPAIKQLPGSLAAKELAFLQETKPSTLQEPATIKRLIGMVKDDISVNRALVKRADDYVKQSKLGSLQGFPVELQQDEIYGNVRKLNALKAKVKAGQGVTQEEANFAKAVEKELGL